MASPYDQYNAEIQCWIRQGCSPNEVLAQLRAKHPQLSSEAAVLLKHIQAVERAVRQTGR